MLPHVFARTKIVPKWDPPEYNYGEEAFAEEMKLEISDDFVLNNLMKILKVPEVYEGTFTERRKGIDYHGSSILDSKAMQTFWDELKNHCAPSEERDELMEFLSKAMEEEMYVIHFGI
jgi:hypothetical protein